MKKEVIQEITFCDDCGAEGAYYKCLKCGTEMCYRCSQKNGETYQHSVHFSGSRDGFYCDKCNEALLLNGNNKLFNAYGVIRSLRKERDVYYTNFQRRANEAEEALQKLMSPR